MFHGSEADNDHPHTAAVEKSPMASPAWKSGEPLSDDEREELIEATDWPTTRRYARTLHGIDAAFPRDPGYADPFICFEALLDWFDKRLALWFGVAAFIGAAAAMLNIFWRT